MSDPTPTNPEPPKRNVGGFQAHKPGCRCYPCKARRRKEEALTGGSGEATPDKEINADDPDTVALITQDRTARGRIAQWVAVRAAEPNLSNVQIAERIGISRSYLSNLIYKASKEGWLKFSNPLDSIEHELAPIAVRNLKKFLKEEDKTVTVEFAKGVLFPMYKEAHGVTENKQSILAIKIEFPKPADGEIVDATRIFKGGNIVGRPNIFDGDAVEVIQSLTKATTTE